MNSKTKYIILLISSVVVVYSIIGGMMGRVSAQGGSYQQLSLFMEVIERIRNDYVDEPSMTMAIEGAIRGMVERVDPYGGYLTPEGARFYRTYDPVESPGVGVILAKKFDYPVILTAIPGGPADRAGLGSGDTIEGINGESLREHNLVEVYQFLSGAAGTSVDLNVIRRSAPAAEMITLTRRVVEVPAVTARIVEPNLAYVKIPVFSAGKALEAKRRLESLIGSGASGIILDLRNVAGGVRQEAIDLADMFIDMGTLGYLEGQTVQRETFTARPGSTVTDLPLVVLVNEGTADAAEVVAAAVRDNGRGELVGVNTFGMASVQELIPLEDGWALLLSVAKYHAPNGQEIEAEGIAPTVEVAAEAEVDPLAQPSSEPAAEPDRQLNRAVEILKEKAASRSAA